MAASFKEMINSKTIKRADAMKIELHDIHEEPGFNLRTEGAELNASIRDLADHIKLGGQYPALEVRVRTEGGVWLVDGHRRRRALQIALDEGAPLRDPKDGKVWIPIVSFEGDDAERTMRILSSAKNKGLGPLEIAAGYKRLVAFGWTPEDIARHGGAGHTAQHIRNALKLGNANSDVKALVREGKVSASEAVKVVKQHGEKAGAVLKAAAKKLPAGKTKVTASVLQQDQKAAKKAALAQLEEDATLFRVMAKHCKLDEGMLGETTLVFPEGLGEHEDLRSLARALLLKDVAE